MANRPQKGTLVQGLYKPIHGACAMYFTLVYPSIKFSGVDTLLLIEKIVCTIFDD